METVKVTLADGEYHGTDHGNEHAPVSLAAGETAEVSREKADQLAADFPDRFQIAKPAPARKPAAAKAPTKKDA